MTSVADFETATQLVQPFIESTASVMDMMLGSSCDVGDIQCVKSGHKMYAVTSVIGITGKMSGAISFSIPAQGAINIMEAMTGIQADDIDADVRDAIGEMANMIAGFGKRHLEVMELCIGLPQVIVGEDYTVYTPRWAKHFWVPIMTDFGECSLDVGFDPPKAELNQ